MTLVAGFFVLSLTGALLCEKPPVLTANQVVATRLLPDGSVEYDLSITVRNQLEYEIPGLTALVVASGSTVAVDREILIGRMQPGETRRSPDTATIRVPSGAAANYRFDWRTQDVAHHAQASIPPSGGTVQMPSAGASFAGGLAGAATASAWLTIQPTDLAHLVDTTAIFRPYGSSERQLRVQLTAPPPGESVRVWMTETATPNPGFAWTLWHLQPQDSTDDAFDVYVPAYTIAAGNGRFEADIPAAAFKDVGGGVYETIVRIVGASLPGALLAAAAQPNLRCPVAAGCTVTSGFTQARIHPVLGTTRSHLGVDYRAPTGSSITAAAAGAVEKSYYSNSYGNVIVIRHDDGSGTLYAHLDRRDVFVGDLVHAGEHLGRAGATGLAKGPHLHFEYAQDGPVIGGSRIDPDPVMLRRVTIGGALAWCATCGVSPSANGLEFDGEFLGWFVDWEYRVFSVDTLPGAHRAEFFINEVAHWVGFNQFDATLTGATFEDGSTTKLIHLNAWIGPIVAVETIIVP